MNRLAARLRERIAASGPISFSAFMESALYDESDGFYARGARLGARGAFTTAPIVAPFFARAVAADLRALWERLGRPDPFTLVEVGPGDGSLAAGLVAELSGLPLDLVLCERAAGMLAQAQARVPGARQAGLAHLRGVCGAIVANEVHDACPAHRLRWPDELLVGVGPDNRFRFVPGPPAGSLGDPLLAAGVTPRAGAEYDVAPAQAELQRVLARALVRGALMVLDYGEAGAGRFEHDPATAHVSRRPGGRRPCLRRGRRTSRSTSTSARCGPQARARACARRSTAPQSEWLLAHGAQAAIERLPRHAAERLWLEALCDPAGSGAAFRVLVQERE